MPERPATTRVSEARETARVEAFSDGVFAIAITLLVLELKVPHSDKVVDGRALGYGLLGLWPSFLAFLASFAAILIMWMNHHGLFRLVQRVDGRFLAANGLLLLTVTFVPFPTAVLASHLQGPSSSVAAAFYCGTYVLVSIGYNALWSAAMRGRLLRPEVSEAHVLMIRRAYRIGLFVYLSATALALWNAWAGLAVSTTLWLLWAVLNYTEENGSEAAP